MCLLRANIKILNELKKYQMNERLFTFKENFQNCNSLIKIFKNHKYLTFFYYKLVKNEILKFFK
jgi:hypothetical protein